MRKASIVRNTQNIINMRKDASVPSYGGLSYLGDIKTKISRAAKNAVAVILKSGATERYHYGEMDNLPNAIIASVDNSGTATACIERLEQFIKGDGFILQGLDDVKANKNQTLSAVLSEQVTNVSYLEGYALRLIFDPFGHVKKIYNIDIKTLRRVRNGFEFNPLNGEVGLISNETKWYPEYDNERTTEQRRELIAKQVRNHGEQLGEILYIFRKGLGRYYDIYPVPRYYANIEDIVSDGKISKLDLRNIAQGFRTPVVISTGPIDDQNEDEEGKTSQDYFDEALQDFTGEDASPILHLKGSTEEFKPSITVINIAEILDQTDRASDRIAKRVARVMGVPDTLIGIAKEGQLGNATELKNQMSLFALTVFGRQQMIKEGYDRIKDILKLEGMEAITEPLDFTLSTLRPFDFIPESVIANLSTEEQKELFEIELGNDVNILNDQEVASRFAEFGVGGVQGILGIQTAVSDNTIDILAGVKVLEIIYGFSRADAFQVLGGTEDELTGDIISMNDKPNNNDMFANLTGRQLQNIQRIVRKFNKDELTYEQAELMLSSGFAMSKEEAGIWLITKEEEDDTNSN